MAIREILELPAPILRERSRKIRRIDKRMMRLAHDLVETVKDAGGAGLSAPQVGELRRVIVIDIPEEDDTRIYFNPEIQRRGGNRKVKEGCLSVPGYAANVQRSKWVRFTAIDHSQKLVKVKAEDLLAQAMEHEVDHLNGIMYIDHLKDHSEMYRVNADGYRINDEGQMIDEEGNLVDEFNNLVDEEGNVIEWRAKDKDGNLVDQYLNIIDEDGNVLVWRAKDDDGNLVDREGNIIDEDGNILAYRVVEEDECDEELEYAEDALPDAEIPASMTVR